MNTDRPRYLRIESTTSTYDIVNCSGMGMHLEAFLEEDDAGTVQERRRIQSRKVPGFIPCWLFERAMRWMKDAKHRYQDDVRVERLSEDEFKFYSTFPDDKTDRVTVTITAKNVKDGVAMHACVDLTNRPRGGIITFDFNSAATDEIDGHCRAALMMLHSYKAAPVPRSELDPAEVAWLNSFKIPSREGFGIADDQTDEIVRPSAQKANGNGAVHL
jgi:hypothetical protein